jgi:hypothetical protein
VVERGDFAITAGADDGSCYAGVRAMEHAVLGEERLDRIPLPIVERLDKPGVRRIGVEIRGGDCPSETCEDRQHQHKTPQHT